MVTHASIFRPENKINASALQSLVEQKREIKYFNRYNF